MRNFSNLFDRITSFASQAEAVKVFGPYDNGGGKNRKLVILVNKEGKRKTLSYPKYIYMKEHGIDFFSNYDLTIDHKNFKIDDNSIDNLEALPRDVHSANDTKRVKLVKCKCSNCGKKFERSPRLLRDNSKKGRRGTFCSKSCSAKFFRNNDQAKIDELKVQDFVKSKYYRRKNLKAFVLNLIVKYS